MTPFQGYLIGIMVFITGVALSLFGWLSKENAAVQLGGTMIGTAFGYLVLRRPADVA